MQLRVQYICCYLLALEDVEKLLEVHEMIIPPPIPTP